MQYYFKYLQHLVCFSLLITTVLYCVIRFTSNCGKYFHNVRDDYNDFTEGWSFLLMKRDKSDIEWESITYLLKNYLPWTLFYSFIAELIKHKNLSHKVHQVCQVLFIVSYIYINNCMRFIFVLFLQPIWFYSCRFLNQSVFCTWLCSCISLVLITVYKRYAEFSDLSDANEHLVHLLVVSISWNNLRCTSFYLENPMELDFLSLISYCFYPPTFFTGPFICYEDFKKIYFNKNRKGNKVRKLVVNLLSCILWYMFGHFCLHFIYVSATSFYPQFVESLDYASLCGYGYAMGQFFHIKYLIQYGVSTSLASFENAEVPNLPRCIGRIHLYSDMWRYFDPGLYTFLKRHIYLPLMKTLHYKLLASSISFCFVCVWHGLEDYIIIWTVMNYIGIIVEYISTSIYNNYSHQLSKSLGPMTMEITKNIFIAPLLAFSAVSNFYFFGGKAVGDIFFRKLFGNMGDSIRLLLILYCCCHVSSTLRKIPARKM